MWCFRDSDPAIRIAIGSVFIAIAWISAWAGVEVDSVGARLDRQRWMYPQEKIHVTTDQARYVAGDTVWLRAWVVDAASHTQVAASRYVYVELENPFGEVVGRIKIRERDGRFPGYMPLDPELAEGDYTMTAYTAFMEGPGTDYFFRKHLGVVSAYAGVASPEISFDTDSDSRRRTMTAGLRDADGKPHWYESMTVTSKDGRVKEWRKSDRPRSVALSEADIKAGCLLVEFDNYRKFVALPAQDDRFDVTFHPEGGNLVAGAGCRVGFKAIDSAGRGIDVEGVLVDSTGAVVDSFRTVHRGMGEMSFVPARGMPYKALVRGEEFKLPTVTDGACALHVDNSRSAAVTATAVGEVPDGALLAVLNRGRAVYAGMAEKDTPVRIPREYIGEGIVQFLLVDRGGRPLSERLAFNRGADTPQPTASLRDSAGARSLVIEFPQELRGADVAIAVLDASVAEADSTVTIQSQLLLQGDLRGHVEDAGWYFRNRGREVDMALDALMMTQGWRRYDVPEVLAGRYDEPTSAIEVGPEITGTVKSRWRGKPMEGATVNVLAPAIDYAGVATTDSEGRFSVTDVDFPEGTKFVVQALNPKGDNEHNFEVDEQTFPDSDPIVPETQPYAETVTDTADGIDYAWRVSHINGQISVTLGEITVRAHKRKDPEDIYEILASKTFTSDQLEKDHITSYEEALRKIPGLIINSGNVMYRNRRVSFRVDDFPWSASFADEGMRLESSRQALMQERLDDNGSPVSRNSFTSINRKKAQNKNVSLGMQLSSSIGGQLGEFAATYPFDFISKIQFIHPNESVVFGSHPGGILRFTTKTGEELRQTPSIFLKLCEPLGYQKSVEFYTPKYELMDDMDDSNSIAKCALFWIPFKLIDVDLILPLPNGHNINMVIEGKSIDGNLIRVNTLIL